MFILPKFPQTAKSILKRLYKTGGRNVMDEARTRLHSDDYAKVQAFRKQYGFTFTQALLHIVESLTETPKCANPNCKNTVSYGRKGAKSEYKIYCSSRCSNTDEATKRKGRDTCQAKWGVDNASQATAIKQKKIDTCLTNHGVEHPSQSKIVRRKIVKAVQNRYGVDNVSQSKEVLRAKKKTWIEKYGYDNPSKAPEIKRIIGQRVHSALARKKIVNGHGKQYILQGYEPQALKYMRRFFKYRDIHCQNSGKVPTFEYFDGRDRMYFPDFYIASKNCVVEVKSTYTFCSTVSRYREIRAKAAAVRKAGYGFKLLIMQADGSRVKLPSDWHTLSLRSMREHLSQQGCRL